MDNPLAIKMIADLKAKVAQFLEENNNQYLLSFYQQQVLDGICMKAAGEMLMDAPFFGIHDSTLSTSDSKAGRGHTDVVVLATLALASICKETRPIIIYGPTRYISDADQVRMRLVRWATRLKLDVASHSLSKIRIGQTYIGILPIDIKSLID